MEIDKRVESLEGEFKLMRGELKQTLSGVRDYLVNLKLPPSQEAVLLAAAIGNASADTQMNGKFSFDRDGLKDELKGKGKDSEEKAEKESEQLSDEAADEAMEETEPARAELPQEEEPMNGQSGNRELVQSVPPVNLLANLMRWVSSAKKQIGNEQLPIFLEVYGVSGYLSPGLKDVILHLAEITEAETANDTTADVWSQLILELHGILAGGNSQMRPLGSVFGGNMGADRSKPKQSKLKLVLSGSDGKDKEFSLDLKPEKE